MTNLPDIPKLAATNNILITKGKAILLSKDIIKEVKDLEEFLK